MLTDSGGPTQGTDPVVLSPSDPLAAFSDRSLLILDDDRPFSTRLARAMEARGYQVQVAESVAEQLKKRVHTVLDRHGLEYDLTWTLGGQPFLTTPGELVRAVQASIKEVAGIDTELSTTGGTSDGRFISQICKQVIELGPPNATIHKIDEHIALADVEPLTNIYRRTLELLNAGAFKA